MSRLNTATRSNSIFAPEFYLDNNLNVQCKIKPITGSFFDGGSLSLATIGLIDEPGNLDALITAANNAIAECSAIQSDPARYGELLAKKHAAQAKKAGKPVPVAAASSQAASRLMAANS